MASKTYLPGVALITGAASGVGKGAALTFAKEGCTKIFLTDVNEQGLADVKRQITSKYPDASVKFARVDIAEEKSVQALIEACVEAFSRIDYACNVAGVVPPRKPLLETNVETYDMVVGINEIGVWFCHRAEIAQMLKQEPLPGSGDVRGSIVSISSVAGINASPGVSPYSSTKHAIIGISKTDAQNYGPHGIRVNVVCPGVTDTPAFRKITPAGAEKAVTDITPLRRLGKAEEIGEVIVFLSSSKASFMTGAVVVADGGIALQRKTDSRTGDKPFNHVS